MTNDKIKINIVELIEMISKGEIRLTDLIKNKQKIREILQAENPMGNKCITINGQGKTKEIVTFLNKVVTKEQYSYKFWKIACKDCEVIKILLK